ncbi:hypothetical protein [Sphaerisporangium perillae]|uniref:hypothetical protein n=1 Tax=Sphaerisporangium perillae TaxID=2935860 RepID=UPI00200F7FFC|nr:hypothetical protein [Sphaerisporangium perillae]
MTLADRVKKITKSKPFYAATGAGDYAVENLRKLRMRLRARQGEVRETAKELPGKARETVVKSLPEQAREYADTTTAKVTEFYDDLAARGRKIVSTMSREAAKELEDVSQRATPATADQRSKAAGTKPAPSGRATTRA